MMLCVVHQLARPVREPEVIGTRRPTAVKQSGHHIIDIHLCYLC